jgi:hypothetical protein
MSKQYTFRAVIVNGDQGGAYVTIPFDVEQAFGKKRVPVKALIGGEPYRGSLVRMGGDDHILIIRKDIRAKIGKAPGDEVEIRLEEDTEPRQVVLPPELAQALETHSAAAEVFKRLPYSHQKEYVDHVAEAKRSETRQARAARAVEQLLKESHEH